MDGGSSEVQEPLEGIVLLHGEHPLQVAAEGCLLGRVEGDGARGAGQGGEQLDVGIGSQIEDAVDGGEPGDELVGCLGSGPGVTVDPVRGLGGDPESVLTAPTAEAVGAVNTELGGWCLG